MLKHDAFYVEIILKDLGIKINAKKKNAKKLLLQWTWDLLRHITAYVY